MLDADLAELYGVTTKRLNEQVKRNRNRFPEEFMFKLKSQEKAEVVAKCDHLKKLRFSAQLPFAFTEYGALMLASVLNSDVAVQASIHIVRAFIRMREAIVSHEDLKEGRFNDIPPLHQEFLAIPLKPPIEIVERRAAHPLYHNLYWTNPECTISWIIDPDFFNTIMTI